MKKLTTCLAALLMTALLYACGGADDTNDADGDKQDPSNNASAKDNKKDNNKPSSDDDLTGKMLSELEGVAEQLKSVKDEASAKAAAQYIIDYAERNKALVERFKSLTTAEQVASTQKHAQRNMTVNMAIHKEMTRIQQDPALLAHLGEAFKQLQNK